MTLRYTNRPESSYIAINLPAEFPMLRSLLALTGMIFAPVAFAQDAKSSKPKFLYGHDVKVRNVGEKNFTPMTPKVGVEFFQDSVGNALIAITEAGHIAVAPLPSLTTNKT